MGFEASIYINPQLSGPYFQSFIQGVFNTFAGYYNNYGTIKYNTISALQYYYGLSIDTADGYSLDGSGNQVLGYNSDLLSIGYYLGIGWPTGTGYTNSFTLSDSSVFPSGSYGMSDSTYFPQVLPTGSGVLTSIYSSAFINDASVRILYKAIAKYRYSGILSITIIDEIVLAVVGNGVWNMTYVNSGVATGDIVVTISASATPGLTIDTEYALTSVFLSVCTTPNVVIVVGT